MRIRLMALVCGLGVGGAALGQAPMRNDLTAALHRQNLTPVAPPMTVFQPRSNPGALPIAFGGVRPVSPYVSPVTNRLPTLPPSTVTFFPRRGDGQPTTIETAPGVFFPAGSIPATIDGGGFSLDGQFTSDHWKLGVHLGDELTTDHRLRRHRSPPIFVVGGNPWGWFGPYAYRYGASLGVVGYDSTYLDPNLYVQQPQSQPAPPQAQAPPPQLTVFEQGVLALYQGDSAEAVAALRQHLRDNPSDTQALRVLALALLDDNKPDDAAAVMASAYRTDPGLATRSIRYGQAGVTEARLRELLVRAVQHAHRVKSASAWLTVAVLMQAQGRESLALEMLGRAEKAGLSREIADPMKAELK